MSQLLQDPWLNQENKINFEGLIDQQLNEQADQE